jgi:hypothetical protein
MSFSNSRFRRRAAASGLALALGLPVLTVSISQADDGGASHVERGKIVGWPGGLDRSARTVRTDASNVLDRPVDFRSTVLADAYPADGAGPQARVPGETDRMQISNTPTGRARMG